MTRGETRRALSALKDDLRGLLSVRWVRWAAILLVIALTGRLALESILAATVNRLAAQRDLVCEWEDLDISIFSGRGEIHFLEVRPKEGAENESPEPLLSMEYALFDLDVLALFTGRISIARAEVDGMDSWWIRESDGSWNIGHHVHAAELLALLEPKPETEEEEQPTELEPIDLSPPISIEALRFQHARYIVLDRTVEPPRELVFQVTAGLSNLNHPERPTRFSATILGGDLVDAAHIEGHADWSEDSIALTMRAQAGSIHLGELQPYLDTLDIRASSDTLEARLLAQLDLSVIGEQRDTLRARAKLHDIFLKADGGESLALDRFELELDSFSPDGALLPGIEIEGLRGRASIEADSALRIAGLDITGTRWLDSIEEVRSNLRNPDAEAGGLPKWMSLLFEKDEQAYPWRLNSLAIRDGLIDFTDHTTEPASEFPLHIDLVDIGEVAHRPDEDAKTIPIHASLRAPGLAETIEVNGSVGPFAPMRSIDLSLQVDGIVLESLDGYMQRAGIERALQRGSFHARLVGEAETDRTGRTEGFLAVEQVALEDDGNLFGVQGIRADDLLFDPAEGLLRFGNFEISGTRLSIGRDSSNRFFAVGLRTLGFAPETTGLVTSIEDQATPAAAPGAPGAALRLPRVEVGRLAWIDSDVEFVDYLTEPPRHVTLDELSFELLNLTLGGDPDGPVPEPAQFTARMAAPELLDELAVEGRIHSRPGPIDLTVELALRGSGGTGELAKPYLLAIGVEPALTNASLNLDMEANVKHVDGGWSAGLVVENALLEDDGAALLACEELRVESVRVQEGVDVGSVTVTRPRANLRRDADGQLVIAGVRLIGSEDEGTSAETAQEAKPPVLQLPTLPTVDVHEVTLEDARVAWHDALFEPAIETELAVNATATGLSTRGTPGAFQARLQVVDVIERLFVEGEVSLGSHKLGLTANVTGAGVRAGPLERLLPEGFSLESSDGRMAGSFAATLEQAEEGGLRADLLASDVSWGEDEGAPWLSLASGHMRVPRLDLAEGLLVVGPITATGVAVEAWRDANGGLHAMGAAIEPVAESTVAPVEVAPEEGAGEEEPSAVARLPFRRIEIIDEVHLNLTRLRLRDEGLGEDAAPLELGSTFELQTPLVVLDDEPQELGPIAWQVQGSLDGLVQDWVARGELLPFASEPTFRGTFEATGIRTQGVVERVPELAGMLEGVVENGTLSASLNGTLFVRRVRPAELGISRPFGADLHLESFEYRDAPGGTILAGIDEIHVEVERVDSARGLVHVKTVEVHHPRGIVRRKDMDFFALGFAVHLAEPEPQVAEAEPPAPVEAAAPVAEPEPGEAPEAPTSEVRVDQILVGGIEFDIIDETSEEVVAVPLRELDVEITRLSTRALTEKRPIRFNAIVEPDSDEDPPAFEEATAAGSVSLYPELDGWIQMSMVGLELPRFAPIAATESLDIKDGSMDASMRVRLKGASGASVDSSLVFTDLSLEEPEGGFLEQSLSLPMALDSALFLLKNADGEHRFSTGFHVDEGGIGHGQLALAASRAFAEVLARALAAVPLRLLGALIPGGEDEPEANQVWAIAFGPGSTEAPPSVAADIREAATQVASNSSYRLTLTHELTAADVAQAEVLANPSHETCLELVTGLRQRKTELLRTRDEVSKEAHVLHAIGDARALEASEELRIYERELASIEDALDRLLEILRSESPRKRLKRTRTTAREIAELRLESVETELHREVLGSKRERIEIRAPRFKIAPGDVGGRVLIELRQR